MLVSLAARRGGVQRAVQASLLQNSLLGFLVCVEGDLRAVEDRSVDVLKAGALVLHQGEVDSFLFHRGRVLVGQAVGQQLAGNLWINETSLRPVSRTIRRSCIFFYY